MKRENKIFQLQLSLLLFHSRGILLDKTLSLSYFLTRNEIKFFLILFCNSIMFSVIADDVQGIPKSRYIEVLEDIQIIPPKEQPAVQR